MWCCCPSRSSRTSRELRDGQVLWGWPHCVQDDEITQLAIDKRLTLIAFEAMNHWASDGGIRPARLPQEQRARRLLLGAARAAARAGSTGDYGRRLTRGRDRLRRDRARRGHGAERARRARGAVLTNRGVAAVASPIHSARIIQFDHDDDGPYSATSSPTTGPRAARAVPGRERHRRQLHAAGPERPADLPARRATSPRFRPGSLIVDVSCDEGMGFELGPAHDLRRADVRRWATTSTTTRVDHSPSYLWNSATWEISEALLPVPAHGAERARQPGTPTRRSAAPSRSGTASS